MNCGICGSEASTVHLVSGACKLVKCDVCGLIYVSNFGETSYAGDE